MNAIKVQGTDFIECDEINVRFIIFYILLLHVLNYFLLFSDVLISLTERSSAKSLVHFLHKSSLVRMR